MWQCSGALCREGPRGQGPLWRQLGAPWQPRLPLGLGFGCSFPGVGFLGAPDLASAEGAPLGCWFSSSNPILTVTTSSILLWSSSSHLLLGAALRLPSLPILSIGGASAPREFFPGGSSSPLPTAGRVLFSADAEVQRACSSWPHTGVAGGLVDDGAHHLLRCQGPGSADPCCRWP